MGINTADTRARIHTLVSQASLIRLAVRAECALRLATLVRITMIVVDADASSSVILPLAHGIRAAGRGITGVHHFDFFWHALYEWIAVEATRASAYGCVVGDLALSVLTARALARILTALIDASSV